MRTNHVNARDMASQAKFFESYSRWDDEKGRYEDWNTSVDRVMDMHLVKYDDKLTPKLLELIDEAREGYKRKVFLGAQRALQFGGESLLAKNLRLYNCTSSYCDRPEFFNQFMWILLCGAGAGFSIQKHHVAKLPKISARRKNAKVFTVPDSIEGWADAVGVLLSSYFVGGGVFPEYEGRKVLFDTSLIRPKGAMITGGFKAPGPEPLRLALEKIEHLLQGLILKGIDTIAPIHAYDIAMHCADAVLSGGVRRAATIALFSLDDEEMMNAKTGNWFIDNPQRARANNSVVLVRDELTREQFAKIMKSTREFGEPGFAFLESTEFTYNPCFEIGMIPTTDDGQSGWQGCNLTEINGAYCTTEERFYESCRLAAIVGTLQAGYTDFAYLGEVSESIFEKEALLGVSITGWMNNPEILFDEEILKKGAEIVKATNREVAAMIGINPAARTTCAKPSGNASVLLATASGIHPEHSPMYIRNAQMNKESEVAQLIRETNPYMVEDSVWSASNSDYIISFPIISPERSLYKDQMMGVELLKKVKLAQMHWVENGTNLELCRDERIRHNISNTITVPDDQWDNVEQYLYDNRYYYAGVSLLSASGDRDYAQAPFTQVFNEDQLVEMYGSGALFASGLIVDALNVFTHLWNAFDVMKNEKISSQEQFDRQKDWIRRFQKFATNYFEGDRRKAEYCLKDVYNFHKFNKIQKNFQSVDFATQLQSKKFTDVDTMGGAACAAGGCDITF